jgi:hypothetical protein
VTSLRPTTISYDDQQRDYNALSRKWWRKYGAWMGLRTFCERLPFATLQQAAAAGPVIVINVSEYRSSSDAIILHTGEPALVPLPKATPENLTELASHFTNIRSPGSKTFFEGLQHALKELWETIVGPVVERLKILGVPAKSRIWWCPTAELCALPIHAAGLYAPGNTNLLISMSRLTSPRYRH